MQIIRPDLTKRLSQLTDELKRHADPTRVKARRQREARKLAYLTKLGVLPPRATKTQLATAWRMYGPHTGAPVMSYEDVLERLKNRDQPKDQMPDFNDDIPF